MPIQRCHFLGWTLLLLFWSPLPTASKEILCSYSVHVDAVAGWLGSFGAKEYDMPRGMFAGEVGTPRLLELFKRYGIKTSWFIPGHSVETFPEEMKAVAAAGHEIGIHGYSHENPTAMTSLQEEAVLDKSIELVKMLQEKPPVGYVAPWWEFSNVTADLLLKKGIKYDHSLMHQDFQPYYVRTGDSWTKIDTTKEANKWMTPLRRGPVTNLVEIPASWNLDDFPPMAFVKELTNSHGFVNPRHIERMWLDQFDWVYRESEHAVFTMTIHPGISGRPHVLSMHERIIDYISQHPGVRWVTFEEIFRDFVRRNPQKKKGNA